MEKIVRITIITTSLTFIAEKEMGVNVTVSSVDEIEPTIRRRNDEEKRKRKAKKLEQQKTRVRQIIFKSCFG